MKPFPTSLQPPEVSAGMEHSTQPLSCGKGVFRFFFFLQPCLVPHRRQRSHLHLLILQEANAMPVAAGQVWSVSHSLPASLFCGDERVGHSSLLSALSFLLPSAVYRKEVSTTKEQRVWTVPFLAQLISCGIAETGQFILRGGEGVLNLTSSRVGSKRGQD